MKSSIIVILVFICGCAHAGQELESVLPEIQGEWHEQGQVCGTVLQFDHPDIIRIKTGESEAHGKFKIDDATLISEGFNYRFDINISGNNGIGACDGSIVYEVGDFPPMRFRLDDNDTLIIEGSIFKREK